MSNNNEHEQRMKKAIEVGKLLPETINKVAHYRDTIDSEIELLEVLKKRQNSFLVRTVVKKREKVETVKLIISIYHQEKMYDSYNTRKKDYEKWLDETYIDVQGMFPWRFEQHVREGGFSMDFAAFFDHRKGVAKTSKGTYEIPPNVNDIVSTFFYARTLDYTGLEVGDKFELHNFYKKKVYPLDVIYKGKETVEVEAGTFDCIMVEPVIVEGGLFKTEGKIIIWLTDDELRIPVKVKTKILIGSIDAELAEYEGLLK